MKKSTLIFFGLSFLFVLFIHVNANAQCSIEGTASDGSIIDSPISCDFPIWTSSGDKELDNQVYLNDKQSFSVAHSDDAVLLTKLSNIIFKIDKADYLNLPELKRQTIDANPTIYIITN